MNAVMVSLFNNPMIRLDEFGERIIIEGKALKT